MFTSWNQNWLSATRIAYADRAKPLLSGCGPETTAAEVLVGRDLRRKVAIVTGGHAGTLQGQQQVGGGTCSVSAQRSSRFPVATGSPRKVIHSDARPISDKTSSRRSYLRKSNCPRT